jgi:hypothetical protein
MMRKILVLAAVLAISLTGAATAAQSGVYRGFTSEKGLIRLTVRNNHLANVYFAVTFFGSDCAVAGAQGRAWVPITRNAFRVTVHAGRGKIDVHLTGHFTGRRVNGTLSGTYGGPACKTGNTTYQAWR